MIEIKTKMKKFLAEMTEVEGNQTQYGLQPDAKEEVVA
jgi:hypothetical protein